VFLEYLEDKSISKLKYFELKYDGLHSISSLYSKKSFSSIASGLLPSGALSAHPTIFLGKAVKLEKCRSVTPIGSEFYG
jgi:hypothetical protein